ncbi:MAG TPA: AMIN domain-containing protein [Terriglobales bacterium]
MPQRTTLTILSWLLALLLVQAAATAQAVPEGTTAPSATDTPQDSPEPPKGPLVVRKIRILHEPDNSSVEITSDGALIPTITKLDGPPRLVVDLPGTVTSAPDKPIEVHSGEIKDIRVSQFQDDPPVTRIVVDLTEPRGYEWKTVENRLVVRLRPVSESVPDPPPAAPGAAFTKGIQPLSSGSGGTGAVVLSASRLAPGSSVTAGEVTTVLNLTRGGQVHVCPGTTISITSSPSGREMLLAMSTGALEAHYNLKASADSILTPDFRIMFPGPGQFDYAVSADSKGNTCVRTLPGNTASAVVSDLMGDGTYQVKPDEQVVFHAGQLMKADEDVPIDCGCPGQQHPILRTEAPAPVPSPASVAMTTSSPEQAPAQPTPTPATMARTVTAPPAAVPRSQPARSFPAQATIASAPPSSAPRTSNKPQDIQVQVEAPLVFRATDQPPSGSANAKRSTGTGSASATVATNKQPPAQQSKPETQKPEQKERRGFFGSIGHFFKSLFG